MNLICQAVTGLESHKKLFLYNDEGEMPNDFVDIKFVPYLFTQFLS